MVRISLTLATLALTATSAFAAEASFDKTVPASANVSVSTGSGYIHVSPGTGKEVHIVGHVHSTSGWMSGDAEAKVKQIAASPPIEQSGDTLTIGTTHNDSIFNNVSIDYDVTLPASTILQTSAGSGSIQIAGISGPSELRASTGSGSIHIEGLAGGLRAGTGSGSIEVAGSPTSDWRLTTGSGGIRINPGAAARFNLNATTGSGGVHVDQPITMQGSLNSHHVTGAINGGGPTIRATTGSGSITIQ